MLSLERLLHSQGFGSRAQCRQLVLAGAVTVNGVACDDPQQPYATAGLTFTVDGESWRYREKVYLALHKPAGYECSASPQHHLSVLSLLPAPLVRRGVQPAGRLDQDTTGLLLLSDDGQFLHAMASPRRHVPKSYVAVTRHALAEDAPQRLRDGVLLHGESAPVRAIDTAVLGPHELALTIDQGKYHQVKRMVAAIGNRVEALHRERVGGLSLGNLPAGEWRYLEATDLARLPYPTPR